jgi:prophage maintenance system killer protein
MLNGLDIKSKEDEKYEFVIAVASGKYTFDGIRSWLAAREIRL